MPCGLWVLHLKLEPKALPRRQGEPSVHGGSTKQAVGFRLHLCAIMVRDGLRGVCHLRFRKADRRLARVHIHDNQVCPPLSADYFAIACRATDAMDQAIWQRKSPDNKSLVHHSDRGSQYLSIKYTERLAEAEIDLSVGTVGDAYDNALAECVIGLFKTEVINQIGPSKSMREVESETLKWVDWYNNRRLLGPIVYVPPAEAEETFYANLNSLDMVA